MNGHGQPVTAAGVAIDRRNLPLEVQSRGRNARAQAWQKECWDYVDEIGELNYGITQMAGAMARARLFVGYRPTPAESPVDAVEASRPAAEVAAAQLARLEFSPEGLSGLLYELGYNLQVAGECYVVGEGTGGESDTGEMWDVRSVDEINTSTGPKGPDGKPTTTVKVKDDQNGTERTLNPEDSFPARIWRRHPRYGGQATSPMRAIRGECDELLILSRSIRGAARSRSNAGLLLLPSGLKVVPLNPVADATPGARVNTLSDDVMDGLLLPVADESSASSVVPVIIEGKAELLEKVRHVSIERAIDEVMAAQRVELIRRIGQGMNWPVEITTGLGKSNDWSAFAVTQSMFDGHIAPELVMACQCLWTAVIRPLTLDDLVAGGLSEEEAWTQTAELVLWFDPAGLISKPQVMADILAAANSPYPYLSGEFVRKSLGADEDDAPDAAELAARSEYVRATRPAPSFPSAPEGSRDEGGPPAPNPSGTTASAVTAAARRPRTTALGRRLAAIDRALFARLEAAASAALTRALEKAGNRIRNQAKSDGTARAVVSSGVPGLEVAATLGPSMVGALCAAGGYAEPDLLDGSFDDLAERFDTWTARAQAQARRAVASAGGDPSALADLEQRQAEDRHAAGAALAVSLAGLAAARLYDPRPSAPLLGEHDSTMSVPPSIVRSAMATAGGGGGLVDANGPTGGVATGSSVRDFLTSIDGVTQSGWEWSYGDSEREFPGHLDLDGVAFAEWDDEVLTVQPGDEWVGDHYRPADHDGCRCIAVPMFAEATAAADQEAA